jgi:hypothetical protein
VNLVIDASVVIKFFVPEILSDNAGEVLSQTTSGNLLLRAPDLVYPEPGNILWKKHRHQELIPDEVDEIVNAIVALPSRLESFQGDFVGVMEEPIEDGIGNRGITNLLMPELDRQLTGDDRGCMTVPLLDDFQEIATLGIVHTGKTEIVELCGAPHNWMS